MIKEIPFEGFQLFFWGGVGRMLKVKIKKFTVAFGAAVAVAACCLSVAFGANAETIKSDTSGTAAVKQDEEGARTVTVSSGGNGSKALFQKAKLNQK